MDKAAADYAGRLVNEEGALDRFLQKNQGRRGLLTRIRDAFRAIRQKLAGVFAKEKTSAQTRQAPERVRAGEQKLTQALEADAGQADSLSQAAPDSSLREGAEGRGK